MPPTDETGQAYLAAVRRTLTRSVERIKHCVDQLDEKQVWWRPRESANSIANVILHLCGNLRQWVISGAGGTPDVRQRPTEFSERRPIPKAELVSRLEQTVAEADGVLSSEVIAAELLQSRRIQGFDETMLSAIFDSVSHFVGHTQEITYITRFQLGDEYKFAWQPQTEEEGA